MSNLNIKFKKFLEDLEQNIKNKEDLEYIKVQIFNLYNLFFDEISKMEDATSSKLETLLENQIVLQDKIGNLRNDIRLIRNELYADEGSNFAIMCPYCNNEFTLESEELEDKVECPKCKNIIELNWEGELKSDYLNCRHDEDDDM